MRAFDAIFRFLASLKLAVICLATLAATLAYGTKFNSDYGLTAANEYIYQTRGFALLLAFLGLNILCAALIRYPWTKRQTGFVITHVGLLVVIGGSWWAAQTADEGQVGMREGETSSKLIRNHKPVALRQADRPPQRPADRRVQAAVPPRARSTGPPGRYEVVSDKPETPFKLAVKRFFAASMPRTIFVPDPAGLADDQDPAQGDPARRQGPGRRLHLGGGPLVRHPAAGRPPGLPDGRPGPVHLLLRRPARAPRRLRSTRPPTPARRASPGSSTPTRRASRGRSRSGSTTPRPASRSRCPTAT